MFSFCGFFFLGIHLTAGTETKAWEDGIPWLKELCLRGNWLWNRPQSCVSVFSIAGGHTVTKNSLGGKGFLPLIVYHGGEPGEELREGIRSRHWHSGEMLLLLLLYTAFSACFSKYSGCLSRCGTAHSRQGPPCIKHLVKTSHTLTYRPTWWEHFLMWVPLFPNDPGLYQVYKK